MTGDRLRRKQLQEESSVALGNTIQQPAAPASVSVPHVASEAPAMQVAFCASCLNIPAFRRHVAWLLIHGKLLL